MKDIALKPGTNDFLWERKGMTMTTTFLQYMQLKVRASLSLFKGEWYLDTRLGLPYIPSGDMEKTSHQMILDSAIRVKVASIKGIRKVVNFESRLDPKTRVLSVSFTAQCKNGEVLEMNDIQVGGAQ